MRSHTNNNNNEFDNNSYNDNNDTDDINVQVDNSLNVIFTKIQAQHKREYLDVLGGDIYFPININYNNAYYHHHH